MSKWEIAQDPLFTSKPRLVGIKCNGELAFMALEREDEEEERVNDRIRNVVLACNHFEEMKELLGLMTALVKIKYGNLDPKVWEKIHESIALLSRIEEATR